MAPNARWTSPPLLSVMLDQAVYGIVKPNGLKMIGRKMVNNGKPTKSMKQMIMYSQPIAGRHMLFIQGSSGRGGSWFTG